MFPITIVGWRAQRMTVPPGKGPGIWRPGSAFPDKRPSAGQPERVAHRVIANGLLAAGLVEEIYRLEYSGPERHEREDLLAATEKLLAPVITRVQAGQLTGAGPIGIEAGKVISMVPLTGPAPRPSTLDCYTFATVHRFRDS
jgi:hypothetical protein